MGLAHCSGIALDQHRLDNSTIWLYDNDGDCHIQISNHTALSRYLSFSFALRSYLLLASCRLKLMPPSASRTVRSWKESASVWKMDCSGGK